MFGTDLSNRKQVNSSSLFILSLSFSARKQLKAKRRFSLVLERVLSAYFTSQGYSIFPFFAATSTSVIFSTLNGVQSLRSIHSQPHLCAVIGWGKLTHSPPRNVPTKPKHPDTVSGRSSAASHHHTWTEDQKWQLSRKMPLTPPFRWKCFRFLTIF